MLRQSYCVSISLYLGSLHNLSKIAHCSEVARERLSSLINHTEERQKTVEDLIFEAKGVRDDLEMEFSSELSKLTEIRDAQVNPVHARSFIYFRNRSLHLLIISYL